MGLVDGLYKGIRWILGGIFVYAGINKLLEPQAFAVLIESYGLVPEPLLLPAALVMAALEAAAGIGLLLDIRGSLLVLSLLLVLFVAILSYGIWMGLDVDCGCFGPEDPEAEAFHGLRASLYRDSIMLLGVGFLYGWRRYRGIKPLSPKRFLNKRLKQRGMEDAYV